MSDTNTDSTEMPLCAFVVLPSHSHGQRWSDIIFNHGKRWSTDRFYGSILFSYDQSDDGFTRCVKISAKDTTVPLTAVTDGQLYIQALCDDQQLLARETQYRTPKRQNGQNNFGKNRHNNNNNGERHQSSNATSPKATNGNEQQVDGDNKDSTTTTSTTPSNEQEQSTKDATTPSSSTTSDELDHVDPLHIPTQPITHPKYLPLDPSHARYVGTTLYPTAFGALFYCESWFIKESKVGLIIGSQGSTLKLLKDYTRAIVKIDKDKTTNPTERTVTMVGTPKQLLMVKAEIERILQNEAGEIITSLEAVQQAVKPTQDDESSQDNTTTTVATTTTTATPTDGDEAASTTTDETENDELKRQAAQASLEFLSQKGTVHEIPSTTVGAIIGRAGETLRLIQMLSRTTLIMEKDAVVDSGATTRKITIVGSNDDVQTAIKLIETTINAYTTATPAKPFDAHFALTGKPNLRTVEVKASNSAIGLAIGKNGQNLKRINLETGAKLRVDKNINHPIRVITITSTNDQQVQNAEIKLRQLLAHCHLRLNVQQGQQQHQHGGQSGNNNTFEQNEQFQQQNQQQQINGRYMKHNRHHNNHNNNNNNNNNQQQPQQQQPQHQNNLVLPSTNLSQQNYQNQFAIQPQLYNNNNNNNRNQMSTPQQPLDFQQPQQQQQFGYRQQQQGQGQQEFPTTYPHGSYYSVPNGQVGNNNNNNLNNGNNNNHGNNRRMHNNHHGNQHNRHQDRRTQNHHSQHHHHHNNHHQQQQQQPQQQQPQQQDIVPSGLSRPTPPPPHTKSSTPSFPPTTSTMLPPFQSIGSTNQIPPIFPNTTTNPTQSTTQSRTLPIPFKELNPQELELFYHYYSHYINIMPETEAITWSHFYLENPPQTH